MHNESLVSANFLLVQSKVTTIWLVITKNNNMNYKTTKTQVNNMIQK